MYRYELRYKGISPLPPSPTPLYVSSQSAQTSMTIMAIHITRNQIGTLPTILPPTSDASFVEERPRIDDLPIAGGAPQSQLVGLGRLTTALRTFHRGRRSRSWRSAW